MAVRNLISIYFVGYQGTWLRLDCKPKYTPIYVNATKNSAVCRKRSLHSRCSQKLSILSEYRRLFYNNNSDARFPTRLISMKSEGIFGRSWDTGIVRHSRSGNIIKSLLMWSNVNPLSFVCYTTFRVLPGFVCRSVLNFSPHTNQTKKCLLTLFSCMSNDNHDWCKYLYDFFLCLSLF